MGSQQRGFSLVGVLIVVAIFAILGGLWWGANRPATETVSGAFTNTADRYLGPGETVTLSYTVTSTRTSDGMVIPLPDEGVTISFAITGPGGCTVSPQSALATNDNSGIIQVTVNRPPAPGAQGANVLEATGPGGASGPGDRVNIEYGPR